MASSSHLEPDANPKWICITGASSGIGLACAHQLIQSGFQLILGARRTDRLNKLAQELGESRVLLHHLDVQEDVSVEKFCSFVDTKTNHNLFGLINNAGLALGLSEIETGDPKDWAQMLNTNVYGLLRMSQLCLPMLKSKTPGHIINIGSIAGHQVYEKGVAYCASKHAVRAITEGLKLEVNGTGVRVTTVDPGMVNTEFSLVRLRDQNAADKVYNGLNPLVAKDIAECIEFALTRPAHVNIDEILVTPTDQASAHKVYRRT